MSPRAPSNNWLISAGDPNKQPCRSLRDYSSIGLTAYARWATSMPTLTRDVLVITLGKTPQVVTETIWALLSRANPFVPTAIHLVTTESGRQLCQARLTGADGPLARVYEHFGLLPVEPILHLPRDAAGFEMRDVRTEAENAAFANTLTLLVRQIASDPGTRLHVSLAGGRKTMSAYAAAAISLFGRDRDELSHVLVEPAMLEQSQTSWFQPSRLFYLPEGCTYPCTY